MLDSSDFMTYFNNKMKKELLKLEEEIGHAKIMSEASEKISGREKEPSVMAEHSKIKVEKETIVIGHNDTQSDIFMELWERGILKPDGNPKFFYIFEDWVVFCNYHQTFDHPTRDCAALK